MRRRETSPHPLAVAVLWIGGGFRCAGPFQLTGPNTAFQVALELLW
jgi:hypothetical protein